MVLMARRMLSDFGSVEDFVERGVGFDLKRDGLVAGIAYSFLVCSRGIEVSIFVAPEHRRLGMAAVLGAALVQYCLGNGWEPHWDAANRESCRLAEKLGYVTTETYVEYCVRR